MNSSIDFDFIQIVRRFHLPHVKQFETQHGLCLITERLNNSSKRLNAKKRMTNKKKYSPVYIEWLPTLWNLPNEPANRSIWQSDLLKWPHRPLIPSPVGWRENAISRLPDQLFLEHVWTHSKLRTSLSHSPPAFRLKTCAPSSQW